jgi:transcriptional regulator with XRE-family HTH domain
MEDKEFLERLGMELRLARIRAGISGPELASLLRITSSCIYKLENGKCNGYILTYMRICEALGIDLNSILPLRYGEKTY